MTAPTDAERVAGMIDSSTAYPYELTTGGRECLLADVTALMAAVRSEERERAARIADRCAAERHAQIQPCADSGGALEALMGKHSEALRIADAIRRQEGTRG